MIVFQPERNKGNGKEKKFQKIENMDNIWEAQVERMLGNELCIINSGKWIT